MKRAITGLLWVACAAAPTTAAAQSASDPSWQISVLGGAAEPRGDFMANLSTNPWLVSADVLRGVEGLPVFVGFSIGGGDYGSRKRRVSLNAVIPEAKAEVDVETTNSMFLGSLLVRLQPRRGRVRPYLEGVVGVSGLSTDTTVTNPSASGKKCTDWGDPTESVSATNCDQISNTNNLSDYAANHGIGAGALVEIHRGRSDSGKEHRLAVETRLRWLRGGHAEYLRPDSMERTANGLVLHTLSSRTDVRTIQAGLSWYF
jgi:hypothetical protein